ncbi:TOBE domain-containing protein [Streptomyces sp. SL13]|uniref:TOBE domain-containing protein n=1 Tax=Streptantibioticus silvisoli TaxID=2705255 RepID=A0AA90K8A4_9ACTN|nr:TOBE domain-containing protein [Streptantibioticus silvisoli]MDI5966931.1 TOBE domain-containing protein [Streptantibioticus silvisoli]MDI5969808.1 TOBE domain-containing protein [Streptantibioticus silvisoli]
MGLSIRNQFPGTITGVTAGEAMAVVTTRLTGGQDLTAAITREAVDAFGLAEGTRVRALVKSTEISLATGPLTGISIRNQFAGTVDRITRGEAMSTVTVTLDGTTLTAAVTTDSVQDLGLAVGTSVVALIKSTDVLLTVD